MHVERTANGGSRGFGRRSGPRQYPVRVARRPRADRPELAFAAGVTPQTTSGHLGKLAAARLLVLMKQGRHRYYRLAGPHVGQMLESIMNVALEGPPRFQPKSHLDDKLRHARTCYDHIAGVLGVGLAERLIEHEHVIHGRSP